MKTVLNNLHLTIKFTVEPEKFNNFSNILVIKFLAITVLLLENGYVEEDTFYKETNTHDYINSLYITDIIRTTYNVIFPSNWQNVF